jgi:hypothetical protein
VQNQHPVDAYKEAVLKDALQRLMAFHSSLSDEIAYRGLQGREFSSRFNIWNAAYTQEEVQYLSAIAEANEQRAEVNEKRLGTLEQKVRDLLCLGDRVRTGGGDTRS